MNKAAEKLTRGEQWSRNSFARRKAIVAAGGRQLILVIDKEFNDQLHDVIDMRRETDPKITTTAWLRRMILSDYKEQLRRRDARAKRTTKNGR